MPTTVFRCLLLLSLAVVDGICYAASAHEEDQLSLVQQQLDVIERLATQTAATSSTEHYERYLFDYPRLTQDIQRIRRGVKDYLSPPRAQPRDSSEITGDYRLDTLSPEPSP
ncbi:conjugal transfer protein [Pseudomonas syringae]|uniref:integrative conjugative element protein, RAQPRD family n=1 Tax=Pseudomonas sp. MWU16-30316 TaxID=2878093 RepID=UPI0011030D53|nr:RAQPRD family integrative conjugative element protein [Pseudomonas sp. MWU16-30316]TFZ36179.1 conjugal transfer protein [Pseudomonas syringae]